jgi:hypothetical protein
MSGFSGGGAAVETSSLLELLKNPDAARRSLAQLQKAQENADTARSDAAAAQHAAEQTKREADAKLKELAQREAAHAQAVKAFADERDKASSAMAQRENSVAYRLQQIDIGNAELVAERKKFDSDMAARQSDLAAREAAFEQRVAAAQLRERNLAERRAALRLALAD